MAKGSFGRRLLGYRDEPEIDPTPTDVSPDPFAPTPVIVVDANEPPAEAGEVDDDTTATTDPVDDESSAESDPSDEPSPDDGDPDDEPADEDDPEGESAEDDDDGDDSGEDDPADDAPVRQLLGTAERTIPMVVYATMDKKGKVDKVREPSKYENALANALYDFFHKEGIELKPQILKHLVEVNMSTLTAAGVHALTVCDFNEDWEVIGESDQDTKDFMMHRYQAHQLKASQAASLENDLKDALTELSQLNIKKLAQFASLMGVKPKKGKSVTVKDFLSTVRSQNDRETLLSLLDQEIDAAKAAGTT